MAHKNDPRRPEDRPTTAETAVELQQVYSFTLDPVEVRLLTMSDELLNPYDKQAKFLLRMAMRPERCPACKFVVCARSAWTGPVGGELDQIPPGILTGWAGDGEPDGSSFACPACKAKLIHRLGLIIDDHWFDLAPGQTVEVVR